MTFNILEGRRTKSSYNLPEKMAFAFENINLYWLLKGEGEMFREGPEAARPSSKAEKEDEEEKRSAQREEFVDWLKQQLEEANRMNRELVKLLKGERGE